MGLDIGGLHRGFLTTLGLSGNLGQSKVQNLSAFSAGYKYVGGLGIAMHNALGVRSFERIGDLDGQTQECL